MNISNESGIKQLDLDLVGFYFSAKASALDKNEEHKSGMFSTQRKLTDLKEQLLSFITAFKNKNSIFHIFLGEMAETNLKITVSSVEGEPNEMTKRFVIIIEEDLSNLKVSQLSLSSKIITL